MFPPFVSIKKYSEIEIEELLRGLENDTETLEIQGFRGTPLTSMRSIGYYSYDPTRWRALMSRASNIVRWGFDRIDGELMFIDYWEPPGSRWVLRRKQKPTRW
jgi:hypothetical protein